MHRRFTWAMPATLLLTTLTGASIARANPRPLPFTYIYETLPKGEAEIEQYADLTPLRVASASSGAAAWYLASQFQTEIEFGLTDHLELGLYFTFVPTSAAFASPPALTEGNGVKQRLRYRFADAGAWPIDLAVYGELSENEREIELEAKVILQRRVGPFRVAANAWAEREFYFSGNKEWVLHPTAGAVFERWPAVQPGLEYWMRAEDFDEGNFNERRQHYLGPTVLLQMGKIWWSLGAYARLNQTGRSAMVGDAYGKFWARTVVGINL